MQLYHRCFSFLFFLTSSLACLLACFSFFSSRKAEKRMGEESLTFWIYSALPLFPFRSPLFGSRFCISAIFPSAVLCHSCPYDLSSLAPFILPFSCDESITWQSPMEKLSDVLQQVQSLSREFNAFQQILRDAAGKFYIGADEVRHSWKLLNMFAPLPHSEEVAYIVHLSNFLELMSHFTMFSICKVQRHHS